MNSKEIAAAFARIQCRADTRGTTACREVNERSRVVSSLYSQKRKLLEVGLVGLAHASCYCPVLVLLRPARWRHRAPIFQVMVQKRVRLFPTSLLDTPNPALAARPSMVDWIDKAVYREVDERSCVVSSRRLQKANCKEVGHRGLACAS